MKCVALYYDKEPGKSYIFGMFQTIREAKETILRRDEEGKNLSNYEEVWILRKSDYLQLYSHTPGKGFLELIH